MSTPVLIVCGSRKWTSLNCWWRLRTILAEIWKGSWVTSVWEGRAIGADTMGEQWAEENRIPVRTWPAEWSSYGKSAGYRRSANMIAAAPPGSIIVAFVVGPLEASRGTAFTVAQARKRGLRVILVEENADAAYRVSTSALDAGEHRQ